MPTKAMKTVMKRPSHSRSGQRKADAPSSFQTMKKKLREAEARATAAEARAMQAENKARDLEADLAKCNERSDDLEEQCLRLMGEHKPRSWGR